ncbi:EpsG family protein [Leuconostoc mesenteroides]|uniref:EpsG family protein n=1 Tax=Leuconostoc mesenteroides TaxID=1245 RepID=UPI002361473A|nr:EpsG family protein [Leuconostoc mesenteroides]
MIYLIVVGINIFFNKVRGKWTIISLLLIASLVYLSGIPDPTTTADYLAYQGEYQNKLLGYTSRFEWLYQRITDATIYYNFDYSQVRLLLISIFFFVMFVGVDRLTKNTKYYWLIFSLGLFFIETIQLRSFGMISFVILGISFLRRRRILNYAVSTFFIFLGTGLHSSGYLFFLVPVVCFLVKKWDIKKFVSALLLNLTVGAALIFSSTIGASVILSNLLNSISSNSESADNIATLYATGFSLYTMLLLVVFVVPLIYLVYLLKNNKFLLEDKTVTIVLSFISVTMIGIPLLILSNQYDRILREGMMGMIILISIINEKVNTNNKKNASFVSLYFIFIFVFIGGIQNSFVFQNILHYVHLA